MLAFEARQAKTDAFLLLTILVCVRGMADAWMPGAGGTRLRVGGWVAFWGAMGIGILVKGPIILLVTGLMAVVLSLHDRGVAWLGRLRAWPGILLTIAIAAPWLVAITIASHGAFLTQSVGADMAAKIAGGQESHGALPGAYLAMFPVTFWPGSLFALLALPWVWRSRRERSIVFALAWVIPSWLVFEAIPTKLPHYVLPLYPGIALLTGAWLANAMAPPDPRWRRIASRAVLVLWAVIGVALGAVVVAAAPLGDHHVSLAGAAAALALWVTAAGGAWVLWRGDALRAASVTIGGAVVAWSLVFGAALPTLEAPWIAPRIKTILFDRMPAGHGPVMIAGYSEPSAMIALGTGTRFGSGADAAALLADDPTAVAVVAGDQAAGFSAALEARHVGAEALGTVDGFNYAKGRRIALTLWRRAP
jgi:4-amino-4-deoxy-L-arabinose transferase-like glycosyltransferase